MRSTCLSGVVLLLAGLVPACPASANPLKSQYTTIELKSCKVLARHQDGNAWECPGLPGYPIRIAEGDDRTSVSTGGEKARAVSQTLSAFNTIFDGSSRRSTLEWRFTRQGQKTVPYATILRYYTNRDGAKGQVLVVTKVTSNNSCHVAYVDALATSNAIALARKAADELAPKFDCAAAPTVLGAKGRSPI